jgi:hypothetical protein
MQVGREDQDIGENEERKEREGEDKPTWHKTK